MKESLFDLFQRHRDCYDYRKDPTIEEQRNQPKARLLMAERFSERKQAAREYASSLIPLGNDWIEAVKHDVEELATTLPPSLHFNKAEREAYRDGVQGFLLNVAAALREYGKGQWLDDLDPMTAYRLGIVRGGAKILSDLSQDEADNTYHDMKQRYSQVYCFSDLFSMFPATYTVLGYKPKGSKPHEQQENVHSGTNSTGMGSNATTNPQTPPAGKEQHQKRKSRTFKEFVKNQAEADTVISVIRELMSEATTPKEKAKIIVACTDSWINKPTAKSVKEEFGIKDSEFSTFKDCITFHYQPVNERAPKGFPFGNSELADIRTKIEDKIGKRKNNNRLE